MIAVERRVRPAEAGEEERLIRALEERPGAWLGCDVSVEGLYARHSMAFVDPLLGFYLDGGQLRVLALKPEGAALLGAIRPLAAFRDIPGGLAWASSADAHAPHPVLRLLRRVLRLFQPPDSELGLYGAWAFDYFRLAKADALPEDGRRRFVLYLPDRILLRDAEGTRVVQFAFSGLPPAPAWQPPMIEASPMEKAGDELLPGRHAHRVAQGIDLLRRGELASLVLSQAFRRRYETKATEAFLALRASNPYPAMFFLNLGGGEKLFGASPDVQVRAREDIVESAPVCGTVRRGEDALDDVEQAAFLLSSAKEAAALDGCADADFNDKASVCLPGSVELVSHRRVHFFSTIVHTISHLRGRRRPGVDALDLLLAHAAPATVAGVPKDAAAKAIERLEGTWRGWYAGAVGKIACDGGAEIFTILRAARIVGDVAEIRTGGNILVDSDPVAEEEESLLKAQTLFRVLNGTPAAGRSVPEERVLAARYRLRLIDLGDPFLPRLLDSLARIGAIIDERGQITLLTASDASEMPELPWEKVLAVGEAGFALLAREGAVWDAGAAPCYARTVEAKVDANSFLSGLETIPAGIYRRRGIRADLLPPPWRCIAWGRDGQAVVAVDPAARRCALLFRPDSILSARKGAAARVLEATLRWLAE